jgi:hypothetical protein
LANFDALIYEGFAQVEYKQNYSTEISEFPGSNILATLKKQEVRIISKSLNSKIYQGLEKFYLDTIYLTPSEIDAGLVFQEQIYTITIWNSFRYEDKLLSAFTKVDADGLEVIDEPVAPINILKYGCLDYQVKVLLEGPAIQDSSFIHQIDIFSLVLAVTGQRVLFFNYEPDFRTPARMKLSFQTVLYINAFFDEQRRQLLTRPFRRQTVNFSFAGLKARRLYNEFKLFRKQLLAVPVYIEPMNQVDNNINGLSLINVKEDIDYYWHLKELQAVVIKSITDLDKVELRNVTTIFTNSLQLDNPVTKDFLADDTVIYPVNFAVIDKLKMGAGNDDSFYFTLEFLELII